MGPSATAKAAGLEGILLEGLVGLGGNGRYEDRGGDDQYRHHEAAEAYFRPGFGGRAAASRMPVRPIERISHQAWPHGFALER